MAPMLALLLLSPAAPEAAVKLLPLRAVGLAPETHEAASTRLRDEIRLMGIRLVKAEEAPPEGCLEDAGCRARLAEGVAGVLDVELLRFGPELQITARLFDSAGELRGVTERAVMTEGFQIGGTLLGAEFAQEMRALVADAAPPGEASEPAEGGPEGANGAAGQTEAERPSVLGLSITGAGGAVAALGLLGLVGGGVLYGASQATLYSSSAVRDEKDTALVTRFAGAGVASAAALLLVAGVSTAAVGGVLW